MSDHDVIPPSPQHRDEEILQHVLREVHAVFVAVMGGVADLQFHALQTHRLWLRCSAWLKCKRVMWLDRAVALSSHCCSSACRRG